MTIEANEWVKTYRRSYKLKTGGVFVYVDSETLRMSGLSNDKPLMVKRYPTKEKKVILKFKEV